MFEQIKAKVQSREFKEEALKVAGAIATTVIVGVAVNLATAAISQAITNAMVKEETKIVAESAE